MSLSNDGVVEIDDVDIDERSHPNFVLIDSDGDDTGRWGWDTNALGTSFAGPFPIVRRGSSMLVFLELCKSEACIEFKEWDLRYTKSSDVTWCMLLCARNIYPIASPTMRMPS